MKRLLLSAALSVVLAPAATWADCVDGSRDVTPQETEFGRKLGESLKAAMPAAPAPLALERVPEVSVQGSPCKGTPVGEVGARSTANYASSLHYSDRVTVTLRANHPWPDAGDIVIGSMPKKAPPFKVSNLVVKVDGHNAQYVESVKQALDRKRLQALIDQPLPDTPAPPAWTVSAAGPGAGGGTTPGGGSSPTDITQQAQDTVNKLRGLFGR